MKRIKGEGLAALFGSQAAAKQGETATDERLKDDIHRLAELVRIYAEMTPDNRERLMQNAMDILNRQGK